jgi:hypothetical protein
LNPVEIHDNSLRNWIKLDAGGNPPMHIDENKKFDKRSIDRKIREGSLPRKEYKDYLASLPDVSDKVYDPEQDAEEEGKSK